MDYGILVFSILVISFVKAQTNCTIDCVAAFRRDWPEFDFEFYHENSDDGASPVDHTRVSYTVHLGSTLTTSISPNASQIEPSFSAIESLSPTAVHTHLYSSSIVKSLQSDVIFTTARSLNSSSSISISASPAQPKDLPSGINCSHSQFDSITAQQSGSNATKTPNRFVENYLLRTVLKNEHNKSKNDSKKYFQDKLLQIYEFGLQKQKQYLQVGSMRRKLLSSPNNDSLEVDIWDLLVDNSTQTIDVIYYIKKDGVLIPYEDAYKVMSFVPEELFRSTIAYPIVHKIQPYNTVPHYKASSVLDWTSLAWLLLVVAVLFLLVATVFYLLYRKEKQKWLDTINKELNRVMPTEQGEQEMEEEDNSHWNYGNNNEDEVNTNDETTQSDSISKMDKGSQYDYASLDPHKKFWLHRASNFDPNAHRERLIPINTDILNNDSDYDRISYVRSQETIQETQKSPNILEIRLSEETQSIVKEIRKELNRYNLRKIISDQNSTSEA